MEPMQKTFHSLNPQDIIQHFNMLPHPEGGFYKEVYRSKGSFDRLPKPFEGDRNFCTSILFLLTRGQVSHFHRILSDELWHYYLGDPLKVYEIDSEKELKITTLGPDILNGQYLQYCVPADRYFASESTGEFTVVGCSVSPGFDFQDFHLPHYKELLEQYPQHSTIIDRLGKK
jgi:predicted cupin superfamily sugar epimerase